MKWKHLIKTNLLIILWKFISKPRIKQIQLFSHSFPFIWNLCVVIRQWITTHECFKIYFSMRKTKLTSFFLFITMNLISNSAYLIASPKRTFLQFQRINYLHCYVTILFISILPWSQTLFYNGLDPIILLTTKSKSYVLKVE